MKSIRATSLSQNRCIFASVFFLALAVLGCATTIPRTDTDLPEIRLEVAGPGIVTHVMTNPPNDHWTSPGGLQLFDLAPNTEYHFLLTVSDPGGVAQAYIGIPFNFTVTRLSPSDTTEDVVGVTRRLILRGSRSDPRNALIISGRFRTPNSASSFEFSAEGDDFGGTSGPPNRRYMSVEAFVTPP